MIDAHDDRTIWNRESMNVQEHVGHVVKVGEADEAIN